MKRILFKFLPLLTGLVIVVVAIFFKSKLKLDYQNIKGFRSVLESIVNFLSIVIGFYSAFYGMIISMQKTKFMRTLAESEYKNELPKLLIWSLISAFLCLIITISMQILVNYKFTFIYYIYFFWCFIVGVFITYAFQTSLLSIVMIFESDPVKKNKISV
ncbi:hypothetical protein [Ligilactobacillus salivarius]|uniref:hypothetical protein n=1 Tax=Ligilactobacillus salivarius TaxID=1624 RepID=UPI000A2D8224|nr:hypothetical protein [Ligilactobacillus salivarius]MDE1506718.1 hypothetical protein [Ligilactobacillus salivarius]MDE1521565.1 hypothetical protein [Ligilactobacillus salivarius]MDE1523292.1 hypothetical protein [Ligilactobacillus salivarius]MYZ05427.1 hypothetical protein [Ligilactobacillus salivarius]MYZ28655.1 hypothetical protein [Ligilactobacillus salivarius]